MGTEDEGTTESTKLTEGKGNSVHSNEPRRTRREVPALEAKRRAVGS